MVPTPNISWLSRAALVAAAMATLLALGPAMPARGVDQALAAGTSDCYTDTVSDTPGLQSYWRLGETAGTSATDAAGSSAGTYAGGPTLGRPSLVSSSADTSVRFDGTDDLVGFGNVFGFAGTSTFTAEAWVRPSATNEAEHRGIVAKIDPTSPQGWSLFQKASTDGARPRSFSFERGDAGSTFDEAAAPTPPSNGSPYHLVGTYNGATLRLYVNGSQVASAPSSRSVGSTTTPLTVGALNNDYGQFGGDIDDVALYNRALSGAEVLDHHERGLECQAPPAGTSPSSSGAPPVQSSAEPVRSDLSRIAPSVASPLTGTTSTRSTGVKISRRAVRVNRKGVASIGVRCSRTTRCRGVVKLFALRKRPVAVKRRAETSRRMRARRVLLGKARYDIAAGETATVRIKISRRARRRLLREVRGRCVVQFKSGGKTDSRKLGLRTRRSR